MVRLLLVGLLLCTPLYAECEEYYMNNDLVIDCGDYVTIIGETPRNEDFFRRLEVSKEIVAGEIAREQDRVMVAAQIEVLARLERLSAPQISVRTGVTNNNEIEVTNWETDSTT